ncbi:hypothetical protein [Alteromonas halophila]|uniref:Uncharacterized protein n=1 Tax=Alteromonas halophila TaxID=516698 RepID=A0A918JP77_9ALTE|nr:hypothetical protein [Alteromonas halophila]GGW92261.1 hypothetical protein GCM10007391_28240 [Alteromonas halophila]
MSDNTTIFKRDVNQVIQVYGNYHEDNTTPRSNALSHKILQLKYSIDREQIRGLVEAWVSTRAAKRTSAPLVLTLLASDNDSPINLVKGIKNELDFLIGEDDMHLFDLSVDWPGPPVAAPHRLLNLFNAIGKQVRCKLPEKRRGFLSGLFAGTSRKAAENTPCHSLAPLIQAIRYREQHILVRINVEPSSLDNEFQSIFESWLSQWQAAQPLNPGQLCLVVLIVKTTPDSKSSASDMIAQYLQQHPALPVVPNDHELDEVDWAARPNLYLGRLDALTLGELTNWVRTRLQYTSKNLGIEVDEQKLLENIEREQATQPLPMVKAEDVIERCVSEHIFDVGK